MTSRNWQCPNEEHPAVRAPEKGMRMDDIRRFCLPCSESAGHLVKRVCPVADRRRAKVTEKRKLRTQKIRAKTQKKRHQSTIAKRQAKRRGLALDRDRVQRHLQEDDRPDKYVLLGIDLEQELDKMIAVSDAKALKIMRPTLHIRKCEKAPNRWGFAAFRNGRGHISVSVWVGLGPATLLAHLAHELAHLVRWDEATQGTKHGPGWRAAYVELVEKTYGVKVPKPVGSARYDLDDVVARALVPIGRQKMKEKEDEP